METVIYVGSLLTALTVGMAIGLGVAGLAVAARGDDQPAAPAIVTIEPAFAFDHELGRPPGPRFNFTQEACGPVDARHYNPPAKPFHVIRGGRA